MPDRLRNSPGSVCAGRYGYAVGAARCKEMRKPCAMVSTSRRFPWYPHKRMSAAPSTKESTYEITRGGGIYRSSYGRCLRRCRHDRDGVNSGTCRKADVTAPCTVDVTSFVVDNGLTAVGTVTTASGATSGFTAPVQAAQAQAACQILNLTLGPA